MHESSSESKQLADPVDRLPNPPVKRWSRPFVRFLRIESASGIVLLVCTAIALSIANSPWSDAFLAFWKTSFGIHVGARFLAGIGFTMSLFIAGLALSEELLEAAKIGTLAGSSVSSIIGTLLLLAFLPKPLSSGAHNQPEEP